MSQTFIKAAYLRFSNQTDELLTRLQKVLALQKEWGDRSLNAFENKYYLEVISICVNEIHQLLREFLLIKSICNDLKNNLCLSQEMINLYENYKCEITSNLSDRNLYKEARNRDLIPKTLHSELNRLFTLRNEQMHKLFANPDLNFAAQEKILSTLASDYLVAVSKCLSLANKFTSDLRATNKNTHEIFHKALGVPPKRT